MKSVQVIKLFSLLSLVFVFNSCATLFYPSNNHQIVAPSEKGSLQLTAGFYDTHNSESKRSLAPDERYATGIQVGFSPIKHLSFIGNYYRPVVVPSMETTVIGYVARQMDLAVGAYWGVKEDNIDKNRVEELKEYYIGESNFYMNYNKWFIDAYIGRYCSSHPERLNRILFG